jgi:hypothetical protein
MTDELTRPMPGDQSSDQPDADQVPDGPLATDSDTEASKEPLETSDPWLKEGADAPDAADIEDPDTQR